MVIRLPGGQVAFGRWSVYVMWRLRDDGTFMRFTRGFVIKPKAQKLFSERYDGYKGCDVGPMYVRSFEKRS